MKPDFSVNQYQRHEYIKSCHSQVTSSGPKCLMIRENLPETLYLGDDALSTKPECTIRAQLISATIGGMSVNPRC